MKQAIADFLYGDEGLTMVEYAVAGSLVTAAAVAVFTNLGATIVARINALITAMNA